MSVEQTSLVAKLTAKSGSRDQLVGVLNEIINECRTESGTLMYIMNLDTENPDVVWFFELYRDGAAFSEHLRHRDTMVQLNARMEPLLAEPAILYKTTPVTGIGLPASADLAP